MRSGLKHPSPRRRCVVVQYFVTAASMTEMGSRYAFFFSLNWAYASLPDQRMSYCEGRNCINF